MAGNPFEGARFVRTPQSEAQRVGNALVITSDQLDKLRYPTSEQFGILGSAHFLLDGYATHTFFIRLRATPQQLPNPQDRTLMLSVDAMAWQKGMGGGRRFFPSNLVSEIVYIHADGSQNTYRANARIFESDDFVPFTIDSPGSPDYQVAPDPKYQIPLPPITEDVVEVRFQPEVLDMFDTESRRFAF